METKIGIAGWGAIGSTVGNALLSGDIKNMRLHNVSEVQKIALEVPNVDFKTMAEQCDIVIEALPPEHVKELAEIVINAGKTLILITSSALIRFPELRTKAENGEGQVIIPSGALSGLDGVQGLRSMGIKKATIKSTKPPMAYEGAPFIIENDIDLAAINKSTCIFSGNALEAAEAFPANVNVSSTLSTAGLGPELTTVEVWADPEAIGNSHEIFVKSDYTELTAKVDNMPDPNNSKTSMLAAFSIIRCLKQMSEKITVM